MTHLEATAIVVQIARERPVPAWTSEQIQAMADRIRDLDRDVAAAATERLLRTAETRPTAATIRRAVAESAARAAGSEFLEPDDAWGVVEAAIASASRYREFPAAQPLVAHAVRLFGWQRICASENADVVRGQFLRCYAGLLERAVSATAASAGAAALPEFLGPRPAIGQRPDFPELD